MTICKNPLFRNHQVQGLALATFLMAGVSACSPEPDTAPEAEPIVSDVVTARDDGDWIRLDGTIVSSTPSTFILDFGADTVTVEVDDWDTYADGTALLPGDRVSVTGRVDENVFSADTIEAGAVYVKNLDTVFYASSADEEEFGLAAVPMGDVSDNVDYTGWVKGTSEGGFNLGAGIVKIAVDTSGLDTALARKGVEAGDRVYVWGDLDFTDGGESKLVAKGLVKLVDGAANTGA